MIKALTEEEVTERIEQWHNDTVSTLEIHEYLGWTLKEYSNYVQFNVIPLQPFRHGNCFNSRICKAENDYRGGPTWEVYSMGLEQWAECDTEEKANAVEFALESLFGRYQ